MTENKRARQFYLFSNANKHGGAIHVDNLRLETPFKIGFEEIHVIEYSEVEKLEAKIELLTQRNQELVDALEKSNRATTKTAEYLTAIESGEYEKNRRTAPLRDYEVLIKDLCTEASLCGIQALSMDREK